MTMYVRTLVPMTLTISSQTDEDDVLLDGNNPTAKLRKIASDVWLVTGSLSA